MTPKTCSKESGAKLEALGITADSYFVWEYIKDYIYELGTRDAALGGVIPAYTACELGEIVPVFCQTSKRHDIPKRTWMVQAFNIQANHPTFMASTEAETRAIMLIWLIEEGHVTVEGINQ